MSNVPFSSPPANDAIIKLQNLLNNVLNSVIDVVSNLSYEGEAKELNVESAATSEYNVFIQMMKEEEEKGKEREEMKEEKEEMKEEKEEIKEEKEEIKEEKEKIKEEKKEEMTEEKKEEMAEEKKEEMTEEKKEDNYFIKPYFEDNVKKKILDRVEKMYIILQAINECIDDLPECSISEEEQCKEMILLQKVQENAKEDLRNLYEHYNRLYNSVMQYIRKIAVTKK